MNSKIYMVVPNWGKECGVAEYSNLLKEYLRVNSVNVSIMNQLNGGFSLLKRKDCIVHIQHEYSTFKHTSLTMNMVELKEHKVPVITTMHSWNKQKVKENKSILRLSSKVIVHSQQVKRLCIEQGYQEDKIIVIPMGCRKYPLGSARKLGRDYQLDGYPKIGFFGFPFPHKGLDPLMTAISELRTNYPKIKGYFFSHYPNSVSKNHSYFAYLNNLKLECRRNKCINWYSEYLPMQTLVNLLHQMDINILPYEETEYTGISSTAKWMMAAQKPVITTDVLNFSDLKNEVFKIPDGKVDTIMNAICTLLDNKDLQETLTNHANLYLERYSWNHVAKIHKVFYHDFLRGGSHEDYSNWSNI